MQVKRDQIIIPFLTFSLICASWTRLRDILSASLSYTSFQHLSKPEVLSLSFYYTRHVLHKRIWEQSRQVQIHKTISCFFWHKVHLPWGYTMTRNRTSRLRYGPRSFLRKGSQPSVPHWLMRNIPRSYRTGSNRSSVALFLYTHTHHGVCCSWLLISCFPF